MVEHVCERANIDYIGHYELGYMRWQILRYLELLIGTALRLVIAGDVHQCPLVDV